MWLHQFLSLFGSKAPMSTTIGDVIQAKKQADQTEAQAKTTAAAADQAYTAAQAASGMAATQLKTALTVTGPVYLQNPDGSFEVWLPDASDTGFHMIKPAASSTSIDLTPPAPAPAPTPSPAPAPAPTPTPAPQS